MLHNKGLNLFLSIIILFVSHKYVLAQNVYISLEDCIMIANDNHLIPLVIAEDMKIARANYHIKRGERNVRIDGVVKTREIAKDSTNSIVSIPGVDTNISLFSGLFSRYSLYDPKKRHEEEAAEMQVNITKMATQKSMDEMVYNIKSAYYDYLYAIDSVRLKDDLLQKYREKQSLAERLYANGLTSILEVSRANVKVVEAMLDNELARNSERLAKSALYMSIGITENDLPNLRPVPIKDIPKLRYSFEELTQLAMLYNPDIQIVNYDTRIQRKRVSMARALHNPTVDVEFGIGLQNQSFWGVDSNNEFANIFKFDKWAPVFFGNFVAAIPVYSGGAISAKTDAAMSEYNKSVYKEREIIMTVRNQIQVLLQNLSELENQIKISEMVVEDSQRHALLARRSYENGDASLMEVNEAEANVIQATLGSYSIKYRYLLTLASIAKLIGVDEKQICQS